MFFDVVQNDITNMSVDAIVLPANEHLREGSGTSHAIFKKAGRAALTKACKEIRKCRIGEAVPTPAFNLDADYIIHAVVPKWIDGEHQEYDYLSAAYLCALKVADLMECESIAFPLLAAGNNGFDLNLAYEIAKSSIESFEGVNLTKVTLVVYGDTVSTFLKGKGVSVTNLQGISLNDAKKQARIKQLVELGAVGKEVAVKLIDKQIDKAMAYLSDEENFMKLIQVGIKTARIVIRIASKKPPIGRL